MFHNTFRRTLVVVLSAGLLLLEGPSALAAIPANDDFDSATVVGTLPFQQSTSTVDATMADDEPRDCGSSHSVWYSYTPTEDARLEADTFGSNYDTVLGVYTGNRGNLSRLDCNDDAGSLQSLVRVQAHAGETLYFGITDLGNTGGALQFSLDVAPPPAEATVRIARQGYVNPISGEAVVLAEVVCNRDVRFDEGYGDVRQRAGERLVLAGFYRPAVDCSEEGVTLRLSARPDRRPFHAGPANVNLTLQSYLEGFSVERSSLVTLTPCSIIGTIEDDVLSGFSDDDIICGLAGNDRLIGRSGNDRLLGGGGDDTLVGGLGNDALVGGLGTDTCRGGRGSNSINGCE